MTPEESKYQAQQVKLLEDQVRDLRAQIEAFRHIGEIRLCLKCMMYTPCTDTCVECGHVGIK